jgi:hypothetical protein
LDGIFSAVVVDTAIVHTLQKRREATFSVVTDNFSIDIPTASPIGSYIIVAQMYFMTILPQAFNLRQHLL